MLRSVAVIVTAPVAVFEFGVLTEVFGTDRTADGVPPFDYRVCSPTPGVLLEVEGGGQMLVPHGLDQAVDADLIAVAGGDPDGPFDPAVLDAVRSVVDRGGRALSVCTGAFVLAAAGVLDGRRATTHWLCGAKLAAEHPAIDVDTDVLFVEDGPVITSAGTAAGIDAALHLVRTEYGSRVANAIARRMVVAPHRDGGQKQFIEAVVPLRGSTFGVLLDWALSRLHQRITVADMAARVHMSERTFARRFVDAVGATPHRWLTEQRVLRARELLEVSDLTVDETARRVGYTSAGLLRANFTGIVGVSPAEYRRRFVVPGGRTPEPAALSMQRVKRAHRTG